MEEILQHLGCIKPCKWWDKLPINWCRISSINSIIPKKQKSRTSPELFALRLDSRLATQGFDKAPLQACGSLWGQRPFSDSVQRLRHQTWIREKVTQSVLNPNECNLKWAPTKINFISWNWWTQMMHFFRSKLCSPTQRGLTSRDFEMYHFLTHPATSSGQHGEHKAELR